MCCSMLQSVVVYCSCVAAQSFHVAHIEAHDRRVLCGEGYGSVGREEEERERGGKSIQYACMYVHICIYIYKYINIYIRVYMYLHTYV